MASYPREISLHNGRVQGPIPKQSIDSNSNHVVNKINGIKESKYKNARELLIRYPKKDTSYSDIPRPYTGVDIRTQEAEKVYLIAPNGGHLRAAYSEVEGLDRFANKGSEEDSSREIEHSKGSQVRLEQTTQSVPNRQSIPRPPRPTDGLTPFERIKAEFAKRSPYKSEARAGKRIGFYRFLLDIGRGNFSKVKLATHTLLNAEVAVKVIDRTKFDAKTRRLLSQELANMERLNHPNIIQLFEFHEVPQRWHLVMEYAPAGELHSFLKRNGRLEDKLARNLTSQIVSALKHMHSNGVVHRDLKAENILFVTSTFVKVGDFGFSKFVSPNDALTTFCGSPPYAAPELFVADSYIGPAVDLWALGVLIYYMSVGHLPFRGDSIAKIKCLILDGNVEYPAFLPAVCKDLIQGLLTQSVDARYTISNVQRCSWLKDTDWTEHTRESQPFSDQIDDQTARAILARWWRIDDWELDRALSDGPRKCLTGIYRILRSQGRKYVNYESPAFSFKSKSSKKSRERKKENHHIPFTPSSVTLDENGQQRVKRGGLKRTEEVTTVDLRDKNPVKGKIDKEGETTSRTCALL
ncbi:Serine/threonine kinase [Fasciola gigantica]|uniref:non-specific serine/threonine protein kinase n=1 Tax=Fasciola gigantica TaxID=46835 RepID=A0A504Z9J2_FASGI|nr:Serine/threonine kinase [Fasciola gigantica]